MVDAFQKAIEVAKDAVAAPEAVRVTAREDGFSSIMRNLASPAITGLLAGIISVLSWGGVWGIWSSSSEVERATSVGAIGVAVTLILGVALWIALTGGKGSRIELSAGPASLKIENEADPE